MNTRYFTITDPARESAAVEQAADILRRGGLLAIPTETVYGLGADGLNADAVRHIFEAKGRPQDNPLILHIPDASWLARYCKDVPETAYRLAGLHRRIYGRITPTMKFAREVKFPVLAHGLR